MNTVEERLQQYGSTLDDAASQSAVQLASAGACSGMHRRSWSRRFAVGALVAGVVTGGAGVAYAASGLVRGNPEEGPTPSAQRVQQLSDWVSEYDANEVAVVTSQAPGEHSDQEIVTVMEFRLACRSTLHVAESVADVEVSQRGPVVDAGMRDTLARLSERNLPEPDQGAAMFAALGDRLKAGDDAGVHSWLESNCSEAFKYSR